MSHVTQIELDVKDLDALDAACRRFAGVTLIRGQTTLKGYEDEQFPCEHAIRVEGCDREIGLIKRTDGRPGWTLGADFYGKPGKLLQERVGKKLGRLKQSYATVVAMRKAQLQGFQVREQPGPNGSIQLIATKA